VVLTSDTRGKFRSGDGVEGVHRLDNLHATVHTEPAGRPPMATSTPARRRMPSGADGGAASRAATAPSPPDHAEPQRDAVWNGHQWVELGAGIHPQLVSRVRLNPGFGRWQVRPLNNFRKEPASVHPAAASARDRAEQAAPVQPLAALCSTRPRPAEPVLIERWVAVRPRMVTAQSWHAGPKMPEKPGREWLGYLSERRDPSQVPHSRLTRVDEGTIGRVAGVVAGYLPGGLLLALLLFAVQPHRWRVVWRTNCGLRIFCYTGGQVVTGGGPRLVGHHRRE